MSEPTEINLSVALAVYNSPDIAWTAMEGLCRQLNVTFPWELIIAEEVNEPNFGKARFESHMPRLREVGCERLVYIPIQERIPLSHKWRLLGQHCCETSKIFVKHDADCYSEPFRLNLTYKLMMEDGHDWVQNKLGMFYELSTGTTIMYHDPEGIQAPGLNKAMLTESIRNLPLEEKRSGVDGWLHKHCNPQNKYNRVDDWCLLGVDTHGLNNISHARKKFFTTITFPFQPTEHRIEQHLPTDVVERLKTYLK